MTERNKGGHSERLKLWYRRPAASWEEALPIGSGRLGAMVYGGTDEEVLQLNEDSLWSGSFRELNRPQALENLQETRRLAAEGRYVAAQTLAEEKLLGEWNESYVPLGHLRLSLDIAGDTSGYRRELDLDSACVRTEFEAGGVSYRREVFASAPAGAIVVRLTASRPGAIGLRARLDSPLRHASFPTAGGVSGPARIEMTGRCPDHVEPNYAECDEPVVYFDGDGSSTKFGAIAEVTAEGGEIGAADGGISVRGADSVTIVLAADSDGRSRRAGTAEADTPADRCRARLDAIRGIAYETLLERHLEDHRGLFRRVSLRLDDPSSVAANAEGTVSTADLPTDERMRRVREEGAEDPDLTALLFQYGRYLLIASSRPGSEPANLQGVWNREVRAPWSSNYTININTQMNYWVAEACNLSECHEPLFDLIDQISRNGRDTARIHYGARGWTAHHNVDFWRTTVPAKGKACWSLWPMGGVWLTLHLWDRYAFTLDRAFLEDRAYPIMKEAALFCLDWLIEDADGWLVTSPSTSPENTFLSPEGAESAVSPGATMDMSLIRQLFLNVMEASRVLDADRDFREEIGRAYLRLLPMRIGRHGQLQEWSIDFDEIEPGHRHFSHLIGLFPGNLVDMRGDAERAEAYRRSLDRRRDHGQGQAGWVGAWAIHFRARLGDAPEAGRYVNEVRKRMYANLFNGFGVFQIDGNFGLTSGIAEMLLQSHDGEIGILPALPPAWTSGAVSGLRARGGREVDIEWRADGAVQVRLRAERAGPCRVRLPASAGKAKGIVRVENGAGVPFGSPEPGVYEWMAEAGAGYTFSF
ncbi:glycosyl hydrolase family 95 catalytic domain-containing protein [Cohnella cellulosilytica]|uniref:Glycoside hydrolase N-terminal domain-containing protein n=1 Tax=Cohnella cellulosilytica TaxID=986710 RepID=A0ABW2FKJ1_9BACL